MNWHQCRVVPGTNIQIYQIVLNTICNSVLTLLGTTHYTICKHTNQITLNTINCRVNIIRYNLLYLNKIILKSGLLKTSAAVNLCFGSEFNILRTRSFAPGEIDGHGSLEKSTCPRNIALNIPCSDSDIDQRPFISYTFIIKAMITIFPHHIVKSLHERNPMRLYHPNKKNNVFFFKF